MMPPPVQFHPDALLELMDGAGFYGELFLTQVDDALALITEMPRAWPVWPGRPNLHRRVLQKVPYAIVYTVDQGSVFVVAVEHTRRRPGYWLTRI
jgi:plasmid stabilization system protein ParE